MADFFNSWLSMAIGGGDVSGFDVNAPMSLTPEQQDSLNKRWQEALRIKSEYMQDSRRVFAERRAMELKAEVDRYKTVNTLVSDLQQAKLQDRAEQLKTMTRAATDMAKLEDDLRASLRADPNFVNSVVQGARTSPETLVKFLGDSIAGAEGAIRLKPEQQREAVQHVVRKLGGRVVGGRVVVPGVAENSQVMVDLQEYYNNAAAAAGRVDAKIANAQQVRTQADAAVRSIEGGGTPEDVGGLIDRLAGDAQSLSLSLGTDAEGRNLLDEEKDARAALEEGDEFLGQMDEYIGAINAQRKKDASLDAKLAAAVKNPAFRQWAESHGHRIGRVTEDGDYLPGPDDIRSILLFGYQDKYGTRAPLQKRRTGRTLLVEPQAVTQRSGGYEGATVEDVGGGISRVKRTDGNTVYVLPDGDTFRFNPDDPENNELYSMLEARDASEMEEAAAVAVLDSIAPMETREGEGEAYEVEELTQMADNIGIRRGIRRDTGEIIEIPDDVQVSVIGEPERDDIEADREERLAARVARKAQREDGIEDLDATGVDLRRQDRIAEIEGEIDGLRMAADTVSDPKMRAIIEDRIASREAKLVALTQERSEEGKSRRQVRRETEAGERFDAAIQGQDALPEGGEPGPQLAVGQVNDPDMSEVRRVPTEPQPTLDEESADRAGTYERLQAKIDKLRGKADRSQERVDTLADKDVLNPAQMLRLRNLARRHNVYVERLEQAEGSRPGVPRDTREMTSTMAAGIQESPSLGAVDDPPVPGKPVTTGRRDSLLEVAGRDMSPGEDNAQWAEGQFVEQSGDPEVVEGALQAHLTPEELAARKLMERRKKAKKKDDEQEGEE